MIFDQNELRRLRKVSLAAHKRCVATGLSGTRVPAEALERATLDQLDDAEAADVACKAADLALADYRAGRR